MSRPKYKWDLHEGIKARLSDACYGRQRTIFAGGQLLLILHEPPKCNEKQRKESVFLREIDGEWWHNGQRKCESMLPDLLEAYRSAFEEHEQRYEAAKTADELFLTMESLNPLLRAAKNMDMAIQSARELISDDKFILRLRDDANEIVRNFELLSEEMKLALDYRIAKNAESQIVEAQKMAKAQHKLNLMAAITFPVMAMSSLFGMNLTNGFENGQVALFWGVLAIGFAAGGYALKWISKD